MVNVHDNAAQNAHAAPRGAQGVQHESDCGTRDSGAQGANMTVGSLFSGIGGMDLGLERAGMRVQWQVEIDPWCRRVLAKHWPDVPKYGDIKDVNELPYVDVIAGGFPCQPVSVAGKGLAEQDERWLWPEFERVIRMVRPRYVLIENTPGLLASGRGMSAVLAGLAALGFDAEWQVLSAAAFGAPHLRERVWIVAHVDGIGRDGRAGVFGQTRRVESQNSNPIDADTDSLRQLQPQGCITNEWGWTGNGSWWTTEPDVVRMVHGIPGRVDRLRGLGNAVVPQVVEYIGQCIAAHARLEATP